MKTVNMEGLLRHIFYFILIAILSWTSSLTQALGYDEYLRKLPAYLDQLPTHEQNSAKFRFIELAPFLIRGHTLFAASQGEFSATALLENMMNYIVTHLSSDIETIFSYIESQFQLPASETPLQHLSISFSPPIPNLLDAPRAITLMQTLAGFSLNPENGQPRLVLHGGAGWRGRLYNLYNPEQLPNTTDWDFQLLINDLPPFLTALGVSPELISTILEQVLFWQSPSTTVPAPMIMPAPMFIPMPEPMPAPAPTIYDVYTPNLSLLRLTFRYDEVTRQARVLTIQQFTQKPEKDTFHLPLTVDIFFPNTLPASDYLPFEDLGWLPVQSVPEMIEATRVAINNLSHKADYFRDRIDLWQQLETGNPQLAEAERNQLLGFGTPPMLSPYPEGIATAKPKSNKKKKKKKKSSKQPAPEYPALLFMPELPTLHTSREEREILQAKKNNAKEAKQPRSQCLAHYNESKEIFRQQVFKLQLRNWEKDLPATFTDDASCHEYTQVLFGQIDKLRQTHFTAQQSFFFTHFDRFCNTDCQDCRKVLRGYYAALFAQLMTLKDRLREVFAYLEKTEANKDTMMLGVQVLIIETALAIISIQINENFLTTQKDAKSKLMPLPKKDNEIAPRNQDLYIFLRAAHYFYADSPELMDYYQQQLKQWKPYFHFIHEHITLDPAASNALLVHHTFEEMFLFGVVLNDIKTLANFLPDALQQIENIDADNHKTLQYWHKKFNENIDQILSELNYFSGESLCPREAVDTLLDAIEPLSYLQDECRQKIIAIRQQLLSIDQELEARKRVAQLYVDQFIQELAEREQTLSEARQRRKQQISLTSQREATPVKQQENLSGKKKAARKEPVPLWQQFWNDAQTAFVKKQYSEALELFKSSKEKVPEPHKAAILVEMADTSMLLTKKDRDRIQALQLKVAEYHESYSKVLANTEETHRKKLFVSKKDLITTSEHLLHTWENIEQQLNHSIDIHERALQALSNDMTEDGNFNRDVLVKSLDLLNEFIRQALVCRAQLEDTFELRSQWLSLVLKPETAAGQPREENASMHSSGAAKVKTSHNTISIGGILKEIRRQQVKNQKLFNKSDKAFKSSQQAIVSHSWLPLALYQRFNVNGDGDCLFQSFSIALNNLQGSSDNTAQSVRVKIHRILSTIITLISDSPLSDIYQQQLANILGVPFTILEAIVAGEILLQGPTPPGTFSNPELQQHAVLQQYGEINYLLLLQLEEHLSVGIQLPCIEQLQNYNFFLWLDLAPELLQFLVQQQAFNVSHWSEELQSELLSGNAITPAFQEQLQHTPVTAIISHANGSGRRDGTGTVNPALDHFEITIPNQEAIFRTARITTTISLLSLYLLRTALEWSLLLK